MENSNSLIAQAKEARKGVLTMVHKAKTSHIASNFSVIDIATVLYANLQPDDQVVWSKGWAAATIYYFLAKQGKIPKEDLEKFPNEPYLGLAEPSVNGVHVAGGAMGHGLPVAVGMALGKKRAGEPGRVFCIISDGEMNEGTTWEAAMVAKHHRLDNLVVFVDANKWQAMGKTEDVLDLEPIQDRWRGFGWDTWRIDGHSIEDLEHTIGCMYLNVDLEKLRTAPAVVICDTIKGKGVSFFENHLLYHYKHVDAEEYKRAMAELI